MAQWYWQSDLRKRAKDGDKEAWTPYSAEDSAKIEKGFAKKQKSLSLNETYTIVFGCMEQQRKDDKYRRRFIRREELASSTKRKSTSSSSSSAGAADDKEEEDEESGRNKPAPKKQQTALKSQGDYNDIFEESNGDNKATDAAIAKAEKALKKTLPKSYKRLMQHQNGGDIKQEKNCHPASPNTWAKTHVCIGTSTVCFYIYSPFGASHVCFRLIIVFICSIFCIFSIYNMCYVLYASKLSIADPHIYTLPKT